MEKHKTFNNHVDEGRIKLVQIIGVPRSVSTALGRSLNEAVGNTVYINEPLNRTESSLNVLARVAVNHYEASDSSDNNPLTVITKSMSSYLPQSIYEYLSMNSCVTLWTVRNPLVQMASLMTRMANDIALQRGANNIPQEDLELYVDQVCSELESSKRSADYSKTGWRSIDQLYRLHPKPKNSLVVDAEDFTNNSEQTLRAICLRAGLEFSPSMIKGWKNGYVNASNGDDKVITSSNAWSSTAATSHHIMPDSRRPLVIDMLPQSAQDHIENIALPTYHNMING
jgi:hypothetical protein